MSKKMLRDLVSCDEISNDPILNNLVKLDYTAADAIPVLVKELARLRADLITALTLNAPAPVSPAPPAITPSKFQIVIEAAERPYIKDNSVFTTWEGAQRAVSQGRDFPTQGYDKVWLQVTENNGDVFRMRADLKQDDSLLQVHYGRFRRHAAANPHLYKTTDIQES